MGGGGGKGGGGGGGGTYDYYGRIAAVLRAGPIDILWAVLVDGAVIWEGPIHRTDTAVGNPYTLSLADPHLLLQGGYVKLYWGDDDQTTTDPALSGSPPFRGMAYMVFDRFLFGRERTTAPNVEIIASAVPRPPASVISNSPLDSTYAQANPWGVAAELLTSIHGCALPAARLDAASWAAAHAYAAATAERTLLSHCSPLLTQQQEAGAFLAQLLSLCDGTLRWKSDGTLEAVWYPVDPGDLGQYTVMDANDLTEKPQVTVDAWDNVPTGAVVNFVERTTWFVESSLKVDDLRALQQAVEPRRETLELSNFVCHDPQARKVGAEWVKRKCQPQGSGTIKLRPEKAVNPDGSPLRVGNRFLLDVDPEPGGAGLAQLCRVLERRRGPTGAVSIQFEFEVKQPAIPYVPTWTPPNLESVTVADLVSVRVLAVPWQLAGGVPAVVVLAQRGDDTTVGAHILFDVDGGTGTFTELGDLDGFAVPCIVAADYAADATGAIRVTIGDTRDERLALEQPGASGAQNDQLLLVIYKTSGSYIDENADGTAKLEWFSIESSALVSGNTYDFTVLRERLGTVAAAWTTNDVAWIIPRASLKAFTHGNFQQYSQDGSNLVFRANPFSRFAEFGGTQTNRAFHFPSSYKRAPVVSWSTPSASSYTLPSDGNLSPAATVTDNDRNLYRLILFSYRVDTGAGTIYFDIQFARARSKTLADAFTQAGISSTLNFPGQTSVDTFHRLSLMAIDQAGNVIQSRRFLTRLATGGGGAGFTQPSLAWSAVGPIFVTFAVTTGAPATKIQHGITVIGADPPASPATYNGTSVNLQCGWNRRLWARAGDGTTWSDWSFEDTERGNL